MRKSKCSTCRFDVEFQNLFHEEWNVNQNSEETPIKTEMGYTTCPERTRGKHGFPWSGQVSALKKKRNRLQNNETRCTISRAVPIVEQNQNIQAMFSKISISS